MLMPEHGPLLATLAAATGASAWLTGSWDARDRAWLREWLRERAAAFRAAGAALVQPLARRIGARHAAGAEASLGEVAEMIDVVRLGLSAGLSFDASLELYCAQRHCALAAHLSRAMLAWRVGAGTREEELVRVARTVGVPALESFALAVAQALSLGAPLADVLATQSKEIRASHRAEVERAIERAPVKLLIPTGTLILPALLLSILGPLLAASGMM